MGFSNYALACFNFVASVNVMAEEVDFEFVKGIYPFTGEGPAIPLPFAECTVVLVAERTEDGWCRGFSCGKEGWFPTSYVKPLANSELIQRGIKPSALAAVLHSTEWMTLGTNEDKVYYVNTSDQTTTWDLPVVAAPPKAMSPEPSSSTATNGHKHQHIESFKAHKPKKPKYIVVNGVTFIENIDDQQPLNPNEMSYVDHFWADKGDQTGYDIILEKHLNGKFAMKDMMEFFKERAAIEEQYARALLKLSKSTLADNEEGTIGKAWQSLKAELRHRSEAHGKFTEKLQKEIEKPLFEFKESQKKGRKEHQQLMERSRKQVQAFDTSIDKIKGVASGKPHNKGKRHSSSDVDLKNILGRRKASAASTGEDLRKLEENYNQAQGQWMDNMISACDDYEKQEDERSTYLKGHFLQYIEICCTVDEASAESLSRINDAVDRINSKADREFFIKTKGTGSTRPVDRVFD